MTFFESCHIDMLNVTGNGNCIPCDYEHKPLLRDN